MTCHDDYLLSIGMKTNVAKTELIYFSRKNLQVTPSIMVKGEEIKPSNTLKVLGVKFQENLKWDHHIGNILSKSKSVFAKLRYLSRFLNRDGMKKVVTAHFYGMFYYSSQIWLNELTSSEQIRKLNSAHYKALRSAIGQIRSKTPRYELDQIFKRATPRQWLNYSNAKLTINLYLLDSNGPPMSVKLRQSAYVNDRSSWVFFMDSSRLRVGRYSFQNRLQCLRSVRFKWLQGINEHTLRINLKKVFQPNT